MPAPANRTVAGAITAAWFAGALLAVSLALSVVYPRMTGVGHVGGRAEPARMPWTFPETGEARLEVTLPVRWGTPRRWNIVPDDAFTGLRVDGQAVPLAEVPAAGLRDWSHGFTVDLGPWLHHGDNQVELTVTNTGGPGGIALRPVPGWRFLLLAGGLVPWVVGLARVFRLRASGRAFVLGALALFCAYWAATPWSERSYDVKRYGEGGHLDYVVYVAEHASLPPPDAGWQFYQPPAYYGGGALVWRAAERIGVSGPEALQAYSLMLWLVFLTASIAGLARGLGGSRWGFAAAAAALAFWPSGVIDAPRIGNDAGLYAAAGVATYFAVRWWRGGRRRHFAGLALAVTAAFCAKTSAMALLAAALALVGLRLVRRLRRRGRRAWLEAAAASAALTAGALLGVARNVWYWHEGHLSSWLVANTGALDAVLAVPNELRDYVPLDVPVFLAEPWVDSRSDATGRANFWNYWLRSSLTGEFRFDGPVHRAIAIAWGVALLSLLTIVLLRLQRRRPTLARLWRDAPWYALGLFWVASAIAAREAYPYSCQADFRYVAPVLVPFLVACARGRWAGRVLLGLTAASSIVFFATV